MPRRRFFFTSAASGSTAVLLLLLVALAGGAIAADARSLALSFLEPRMQRGTAPGGRAPAALGRAPGGVYARRYAAARAGDDCALEHSHGPYGENLFRCSGGAVGWTPADVVGAWVRERALFDLRANSCCGACGHYTQVVWRRTTAIGCAVATCAAAAPRSRCAATYGPPGNYVGMRPY